MDILDPGRLLSVEEMARALDVSKRTVWRMVQEGKLCRPKLVGKSNRWFEADLVIYRYRLMRGDFDPPPPGGLTIPTDLEEEDE